MKQAKLTEEQIVRIPKDVEGGAKVGETYRKYGCGRLRVIPDTFG